ncbi:hypothetical protein [Leptolyngbya sp. 7M]|nr:hypothetical protein [Leptolyngbya sp. 7M]
MMQPDAGGFNWGYLNNSTDRMLKNLRKIDPNAVDKIAIIDG